MGIAQVHQGQQFIVGHIQHYRGKHLRDQDEHQKRSATAEVEAGEAISGKGGKQDGNYRGGEHHNTAVFDVLHKRVLAPHVHVPLCRG